MSDAKTRAQKLIKDNSVMVFSKSYCPYCKATKSLLTSMNADFEVLELDKDNDGSAIQDALRDITGQGTVPNVFIGGKHIGGNSDLQAINKKGDLGTLLGEAGAL